MNFIPSFIPSVPSAVTVARRFTLPFLHLLVAPGTFLLPGTPGLLVVSIKSGSGTNLYAQRSNRTADIPATRTPYGLAFDGRRLWFIDPRLRRLYASMPQGGRNQSFRMGSERTYGMAFNPSNGYLHVGSVNRILLYSPITGARHDSISVKVSRVAGIAFGPDVWYLLEKGTGVIHYYNPELRRIISTLRTGKSELRDIALFRGKLWAADGKEGIIYRYNPITQEMDGSLQAPVEKLRGICFRDGQLWFINRRKRTISRLPFNESDRFIISAEKKYRIRVSLEIPPPRLYGGFLLALHPPRSESQRPYGLRFEGTGWKDSGFTASGQRIFRYALPEKPGVKKIGTIKLRYNFAIVVRNVRHFIPRSYKALPEILADSDAAYYYGGSASAFAKGNPFTQLATSLKAIVPEKGKIQSAIQKKLIDDLRRKGLAARWNLIVQVQNETASRSTQKTDMRLETEADVYLRGIGWTALGNSSGVEPRLHARRSSEIIIARMPDIQAKGMGLVFFARGKQKNGFRKMRSIKVKVKIDVISR